MAELKSEGDAPATENSGGHDSEGLGENRRIAAMLSEIADLLESQHASEYRVAAYRAASGTMNQFGRPVREIARRDGIKGLERIETVGHSIASLIDQVLRTGHMQLLDRLRGEATAERIFATIPTIGRELAHRIYDHLHVETLPELYNAAMTGQLAHVPGLGEKRIHAIQDALAEKLKHTHHPSRPIYPATDHSIPVKEILDVDREYREKATKNALPRIAPTKFNPGHTAWLPILHTDRGERHYTALFSNTARAHELNTVKDWVVVYRDDEKHHGRWTVITSQFGRLRGCRIVRGREDECLEVYLRHEAQ